MKCKEEKKSDKQFFKCLNNNLLEYIYFVTGPMNIKWSLLHWLYGQYHYPAETLSGRYSRARIVGLTTPHPFNSSSIGLGGNSYRGGC